MKLKERYLVNMAKMYGSGWRKSEEQEYVSVKDLDKSGFLRGVKVGDKLEVDTSNRKYDKGVLLGFQKEGQPGRSMVILQKDGKVLILDALCDTVMKVNGKSKP